jgi:hypothetical protein
VTLTDPSLPEQQGVLAPFDKGAGGEVQDLGLGDLWIEVEIKVLQRLLMLEVGSTHTLVELFRVSPFDLIFDEAVEKFLVTQIVVACFA